MKRKHTVVASMALAIGGFLATGCSHAPPPQAPNPVTRSANGQIQVDKSKVPSQFQKQFFGSGATPAGTQPAQQ